jgi:hypothetical protein
VEERPIKEYRLMLFTVINTAALESGMGGFSYQTPDEEIDELEEFVEYYTKKGIFSRE